LLANPVCQARRVLAVTTPSRASALLQAIFGVHMICGGRQIRRSRLAGESGVSGTQGLGCDDAFAGKRAPTGDFRRSHDCGGRQFVGAGLLANPALRHRCSASPNAPAMRGVKPDFLSRPCSPLTSCPAVPIAQRHFPHRAPGGCKGSSPAVDKFGRIGHCLTYPQDV
jgi:hypothetical protein